MVSAIMRKVNAFLMTSWALQAIGMGEYYLS